MMPLRLSKHYKAKDMKNFSPSWKESKFIKRYQSPRWLLLTILRGGKDADINNGDGYGDNDDGGGDGWA